jgi:hypothetical protein
MAGESSSQPPPHETAAAHHESVIAVSPMGEQEDQDTAAAETSMILVEGSGTARAEANRSSVSLMESIKDDKDLDDDGK